MVYRVNLFFRRVLRDSTARYGGLLFGWSVGRLVCWSVGLSVFMSVGLLVCWSVGSLLGSGPKGADDLCFHTGELLLLLLLLRPPP